MARPPQRTGSRRKPPQSDTDQERRFLHARLKAGDRLAVELLDGTRVDGVLRKYSEEAIELEGDEQPIRLLKSRIRYIEEL